MEDACCMGDEIKVKQVLINILGNAVKYTPAPGKVTLIVEEQNCCAGRCAGSGGLFFGGGTATFPAFA
jgi:phosphoglycerate-specific signal transduction histidine kinase